MATSRQKFATLVQSVASSVGIVHNVSSKLKTKFDRLVLIDVAPSKAADAYHHIRNDTIPTPCNEIRIMHSGVRLVMAVTSTPFEDSRMDSFNVIFAHSPDVLERLRTERPNMLLFMKLEEKGIVPNLLPVFGFDSVDGKGHTYLVTPDLEHLHKHKILPPTEAQKSHLATIAQVTRMSSSRLEVPIDGKYPKQRG